VKRYTYLILAAIILFYGNTALSNDVGTGKASSNENKKEVAPGSGQSGTTISLGYDEGKLKYHEFLNGNELDSDTGTLKGGYFEFRTDYYDIFARASFDYVSTNDATYNGFLQDLTGNLTPLTMTVKEKFALAVGDFGYKMLNFGTTTVSLYGGVGYWYWLRGANNLPDYEETYSWFFVEGGLNGAVRVGRFLFQLDGTLTYPISPTMTTSVAGTFDKATFRVKPQVGYRAEAPIRFDFSRGDETSVFLFVTPYYLKWNVRQSDVVTLTSGGIPVTNAVEPESKTEIYGFRIGVGVNF
jgi:hypothetical protein